VPLAENKAVAQRIIGLRGINGQLLPEERHHDIHAGKRRSQVGAAGPVGHFHQHTPDFPGCLVQLID
jgi:hypothetical protein